MDDTEINLVELQQSVAGVPQDIILPEKYIDEYREKRHNAVRRIVDLYSKSRSNKRVFSSTYNALQDNNPFIRIAAAEIIGEAGNKNSFDYLFKALEDEEELHVKQKIVSAIDKLETKISDDKQQKNNLMKSMRVLSYNP